MSPNYDQIPEELRALRNWVVWRLEKRTGSKGVVQTTKAPFNARSHKHARSNDPTTWSDFGTAVEALKRGYAGIGFCLTEPLVGIDLDDCRPDGRDEPWAAEIIGELNTYTEVSPSGRGVRMMAKGDLPDGRRQKDFGDRPHHGIGLYEAGGPRYLTITGNRIGGNGIIAERTAELHRIHARLFPPEAKPKAEKKAKGVPRKDSELIDRAMNAKDGGKFSRLWSGDTTGYPSASEADLALCMKLAFWTDRDEARIDALFRQSGMMRDKWADRADYRERTIASALARQTETVGNAWLRNRTVVLAADAVPLSVDTLNAMDIFHGRLSFRTFSRRGSMVIGVTASGQEIHWTTTADLVSFAKARACIADGADVLLPSPPRGQVSKFWDPAAEMIVKLAAHDAVRLDHVLKAECKDLLILMWRYAGQPKATSNEEFTQFLMDISESHRGQNTAYRPAAKKGDPPPPPPPPAVFIAEGFCWVHVPTWRNWLSLPTLTNRLYPLADIRQGLMLLGFEYEKDVTRRDEGDKFSASLWRGPVDVLGE
jgi:hypothetical protein